MSRNKDIELIQRLISECSRRHMTLEQMAVAVGRSKGWASTIVNGKTRSLKFSTRSLVMKFLGDLQ